MNEKGRETLRGLFLKGLAVRLRDSNAINRSTQPAGRFVRNASMNSFPKIPINNFSNSRSIPEETKNKSIQITVVPITICLLLSLCLSVSLSAEMFSLHKCIFQSYFNLHQ